MVRSRSIGAFFIFGLFSQLAANELPLSIPVVQPQPKQTTSAVADLFGIPSIFLDLPFVAQNAVVREIIKKYPQAFTHLRITKPIAQLDRHKAELGEPMEDGVYCPNGLIGTIVFINKGNTMVTSSDDGKIIFWEIPSFKVLREVQLDATRDPEHKLFRQPCIIAFNDDESRAAVSLGTRVHIYDVEDFGKIREFASSYPVGMLAFVRNSTHIISGPARSGGKPVRMFNLETGACVLECGQVGDNNKYRMEISPDKSKLIVVGTGDFEIWDIAHEPSRLIYRIDFNNAGGHRTVSLAGSVVVFLNNESFVFTYLGDVYLVNIKNRSEIQFSNVFFKKLHLDKLRALVEPLPGDQEGYFFNVEHMVYNEKLRRLVIAFADRTTRIYNVDTGQTVATFTNPQIRVPRASQHEYDRQVSCYIHPFEPICLTLIGQYKGPVVMDKIHRNDAWRVPAIPSSFTQANLTILQALFIVMAQTFKEKMGNVNSAFNQLPLEIRKELLQIFLTFTDDQIKFLKEVFFL